VPTKRSFWERRGRLFNLPTGFPAKLAVPLTVGSGTRIEILPPETQLFYFGSSKI
jgi:hypothetical protein